MLECIRALSSVNSFSLWFFEAISMEFINGCPWELLYGDDQVIIAKSVEELCWTLTFWKFKLENKGFRGNMKKTRVIFRGRNMETLINCSVWTCGVCRSGMRAMVQSNSVYCSGCKQWLHKKCSGIRGRLVEDKDFRCNRCCGFAKAVEEYLYDSVTVGYQYWRLQIHSAA